MEQINLQFQESSRCLSRHVSFLFYYYFIYFLFVCCFWTLDSFIHRNMREWSTVYCATDQQGMHRWWMRTFCQEGHPVGKGKLISLFKRRRMNVLDLRCVGMMRTYLSHTAGISWSLGLEYPFMRVQSWREVSGPCLLTQINIFLKRLNLVSA